MELRELRAFAVAGRELHFARAADQLYMSPSTMSELIRRLELELGAPLFTRTTRRITLTDAGVELLGRAEKILELTAQATEAVAAIARGSTGAVRLGITPPAAPVIAPHLASRLAGAHPELSVEIQRMWLPALRGALRAGTIDVALTCGSLGLDDPNVITVELGREPLLAGLRTEDPLAQEASVDLARLADRTLGMHPAPLFPAWHAVQRQVLAAAHVEPPIAELNDTDLTARLWSLQAEVEWILLIGSLLTEYEGAVTRPVAGQAVPFTLSWTTESSARAVVQRFIQSSRDGELPTGWLSPSVV